MHEQHPNFDAPSDPDISVWRYMNLAKFVSMLQGDALYFARPDRMTDEFEGSLSESNKSKHSALAVSCDLSGDGAGFVAHRKMARRTVSGSAWGQAGTGLGGSQGRPRIASWRACIALCPCLIAVDR